MNYVKINRKRDISKKNHSLLKLQKNSNFSRNKEADHLTNLISAKPEISSVSNKSSKLPAPLSSDIANANSAGQPIPAKTRTFMESKLGNNFGEVKIHSGNESSAMNNQLNSKAFTLKNNIYFGKDNFKPETTEGKKLLAHELTHVIQQKNIQAIQKKNGNAPPVLIDYKIKSGDSLGKIALKFNTTVAELKKINGLKSDAIKAGQILKVPEPATCKINRPGNSDTQILAGAIFAEAVASAKDNKERLCIGWAFKNSVDHVSKLKAGTICPGLKARQRAKQVRQDTKDLGATIKDAVKIGSAAYGNSRWKLIMSGTSMLPKGNLCLLNAAETFALEKAISAATDVMAGKNQKADIVRFNQAADSPPSPRMEKAYSERAHTFYKFKAGRQCG